MPCFFLFLFFFTYIGVGRYWRLGGPETSSHMKSAQKNFTMPTFHSNHAHFGINKAGRQGVLGYRTSSKSSRAYRYFEAIFSWNFMLSHSQVCACADLCVDRLYLGLSGYQSVKWGGGGAMAPPCMPHSINCDMTSHKTANYCIPQNSSACCKSPDPLPQL